MKLFILLPSYNEGDALPLLLQSLYEVSLRFSFKYEVVVIDDGSSDDTGSAARKWEDRLNIKVLSHRCNMGLGEAVNTGLTYFCENCSDDDAAVVMDADNTHDPALISAMLDKFQYGYDTVIASRYEEGGREIGLSLLRRLCSAGANWLLKLFFNVPDVKDYTCGYRAYRGRIIKKAYKIFGSRFIEEKGFTCMAEIIIKLFYLGSSICEVPLVLRYDLKKGRSKMKVLSTIKRYFVLIQYIKQYRRVLSKELALAEGDEK